MALSRTTRNTIATVLTGAGLYFLYKGVPGVENYFNDNVWSMFKAKDPNAMSRLFQYYNERAIDGNVYTDSGSNNRSLCKALAEYGVCLDSLYPYNVSNFTDKPSDAAYADAAARRYVKSYHSVSSLLEIQQIIAFTHQPVIMGITIYESFESDEVKKTGIVPLPQPGEKNLGGHDILCVGYSNTKKMLEMRNSWSKSWGDEGHFWLPFDYFTTNSINIFDAWVLQK